MWPACVCVPTGCEDHAAGWVPGLLRLQSARVLLSHSHSPVEYVVDHGAVCLYGSLARLGQHSVKVVGDGQTHVQTGGLGQQQQQQEAAAKSQGAGAMHRQMWASTAHPPFLYAAAQPSQQAGIEGGRSGTDWRGRSIEAPPSHQLRNPYSPPHTLGADTGRHAPEPQDEDVSVAALVGELHLGQTHCTARHRGIVRPTAQQQTAE